MTDDLDVTAQRWWMAEELVHLVNEAVKEYDLDPMLIDHLEAAVRDQDKGAFDEAMVDLLKAVADAREEQQG